jgi:hypothetical protein
MILNTLKPLNDSCDIEVTHMFPAVCTTSQKKECALDIELNIQLSYVP